MFGPKVLTHNGKFHADEVFSTAVIWLLNGRKPKVIRSRNLDLMTKVDYVLDIGQIYDPLKKQFDHHQTGFNEKHSDGTPRATFGLVWREYGENICKSKRVADKVEEKLVKYIDASDNGVCFYEKINESDVHCVFDVIDCFNPTWKESEEKGKKYTKQMFDKVVLIAKSVLEREIQREKDIILSENLVLQAYEKAEDKRLIVLDKYY
ncbi:MAG: MYG1 family protein, partial [bacterium]